MLSPTDVYVICLCSCLLALFLAKNVIPHVAAVLAALLFLPAKTLRCWFLIDRHALIGPLTVASAILHLVYLGGNIVCLVYDVDSVAQVALRAGTLSLVNMTPLYLATHLSFLADIFGLSLPTYRQLHRSCGLIAAAHAIFHGAFSLAYHSNLSTKSPANDWYSITV
jgi:hypothetical protein